tara:strand:- start:48 stop:221 length:174 start_codon:yes stop_codon:yes gene_type:complete
MRNKKLVLRRLDKLRGELKSLDMYIHRGGTSTQVNFTQREIEETVQDLVDIVEREQG